MRMLSERLTSTWVEYKIQKKSGIKSKTASAVQSRRHPKTSCPIGAKDANAARLRIKKTKPKNLKVWVHDGIPFFYINILKFGGWGG